MNFKFIGLIIVLTLLVACQKEVTDQEIKDNKSVYEKNKSVNGITKQPNKDNKVDNLKFDIENGVSTNISNFKIINPPYYKNCRIVKGYSYEDYLIFVYRNSENNSNIKIVSYNILKHEFNKIYDGNFVFSGKEIFAFNDDKLSIQNSFGIVVFDKHSNLVYKKFVDSNEWLMRSYSSDVNYYLEKTNEKILICDIGNTKMLSMVNDSNFSTDFKWNNKNTIITFISDYINLKFIDVKNKNLLSLNIEELIPPGFVDYINLYWINDNNYIVLHALCEEGMYIQVLDIINNAVVYSYKLNDDGAILDIVGDSLVILDDVEDTRKIVICNFKNKSEEIIIETKYYINFLITSKHNNEIIIDLYDSKNKSQKIVSYVFPINVKDVSDKNVSLYKNKKILVSDESEIIAEDNQKKYEDFILEEKRISEKLSVSLEIIDRLIDKGYILSEIEVMSKEEIESILDSDK